MRKILWKNTKNLNSVSRLYVHLSISWVNSYGKPVAHTAYRVLSLAPPAEAFTLFTPDLESRVDQCGTRRRYHTSYFYKVWKRKLIWYVRTFRKLRFFFSNVRPYTPSCWYRQIIPEMAKYATLSVQSYFSRFLNSSYSASSSSFRTC